MGNRAVITLEDAHGTQHPVATYVHWNGGLESVLAFVSYTWDAFPRGRDDIFTFQIRLSQVIGNFFPDGLSVYGYPSKRADVVASACDNGCFHFRVSEDGFTLLNRAAGACDEARAHPYWQGDENIIAKIRSSMPMRDRLSTTATDCTGLIACIASEELGVETLEPRNSDGHDFHDLAVWQIKAALRRAYTEGWNSASFQKQKQGEKA